MPTAYETFSGDPALVVHNGTSVTEVRFRDIVRFACVEGYKLVYGEDSDEEFLWHDMRCLWDGEFKARGQLGKVLASSPRLTPPMTAILI